MRLFCSKYISPIDSEGTFDDVYIEDISYEVRKNESFFAVDFEMFIIKNDKRIVLDKSRLSFRGTNAEFEQGLPTTNKTAYIKVPASEDYVPESISEEGEVIPAIGTPETIYPLKEYLYSHNGEFPHQCEVVDFGYPTYEDVMPYFEGGALTNPELFINNPFAKNWLLNTMQMKGYSIKGQFAFI